MSAKNRTIYAVVTGVVILISGCGKGGVIDPADDSSVVDTQKISSQNVLSTGSSAAFEASIKEYLRAMGEMSGVYADIGTTASDSATGAATEAGQPAVSDGVKTGTAATSTASQTNTVEAGVDESDFLKTDGQYLYLLKNGRDNSYYRMGGIAVDSFGASSLNGLVARNQPVIEIYQIETGASKAVLKKTLGFDAEWHPNSMFLRTGANGIKQLIIVAQRSTLDSLGNNRNFTALIVYDVSSVEQAKYLWRYQIEGNNNATRIIGNRLYAVSRHYFFLPRFVPWDKDGKATAENESAISNLKIADILPQTFFNDEKTNLIAPQVCAVPLVTDRYSYFDMGITSIVQINLDDPTQSKGFCTTEGSQNIYVSQKSIYLTKPSRKGQDSVTVIHKIAMNDDGLQYRASAAVVGTLGWRNIAFKLDEENGYLRVVTSDYRYNFIVNSGALIAPRNTEYHHLFVLGEDSDNPGLLKIAAQLPNHNHPEAIGKPGESLYGVRFYGDYGYIVTFQKTDPLYVINLKNPLDPYIEGQLVIPGYSDYLHPLADNIVLGIGKDAVATENFALFQGIKVGLFDISDKSKPALLGEVKLGERGTDTPLFFDYKALSLQANVEQNSWRLAFPVSVYESNNGTAKDSFSYANWSYCGFSLFDIKKNADSGQYGVSQVGTLKTADATNGQQYCYLNQARGALVDDSVFYTEAGDLWSASWGDPATIYANNRRAQQILELRAAKAKWRANNAISYRFDFKRQCQCTFDETHKFDIDVLYGRVASVKDLTTGANVNNISSGQFFTVENLFFRVESALAANFIVDANYDSQQGYLSQLTIKENDISTARSLVYEVSNLQIKETVAANNVVKFNGRILTLSNYYDNRGEYIPNFLLNTDDGQYIELFNGSFVWDFFNRRYVDSSRRYTISGFWVGPANSTTSKFIVTQLSPAI